MKKKWKSADEKHRVTTLQKEWEEKVKEWDKTKSFTKKRFKQPTNSIVPAMGTSRPTQENIPSVATQGGNIAAKKESPVYTGTKVKGIATMHKSNMVPVFSDEEIVDIANMRRNDYTRNPIKG